MKRVLIVKLAALGDVLRTTSLLEPLRLKHRGCRITWVTSAAAKPLLAGHPAIDAVMTDVQAARSLTRPVFDLALSLEEAPVCEVAARSCRGELVGVVRRPDGSFGYTASSAPYYDMSLLHVDAGGGHRAADALKAANRLGYAELWGKILGLKRPAGGWRPSLYLKPADRRRAALMKRRFKLESKRPPIGFNPGAGARWPAKQLSEEKAAAVLRALSASGRPVIVLGGGDEVERNARIVARAGVPAIVPGALPLRAFAGVVALCGSVVTTDSLAFHVAAALGKKTVVLVGPTSAAELEGGPKGVTLTPPGGCSCFYKPRCELATPCLDAISDDVIRGAAA